MDRYLEQHFKSRWRIRAHYDQSTNDWCRDHHGDYEESFADFYIDCKNNIEIKHGVGNILSCYIPSKSRGMNILRQMFIEKISSNDKNINDIDYVAEKLVEMQILLEIDVLDVEVYFTFKTSQIDYIAKLVGARTSGASISPLSVKNLPKNHYEIPEGDSKQYSELIKLLPKRTMERQGKDGKTLKVEIPDGVIVNNIMKGFEAVIKKNKGKGYDLNAEQRKVGLKGREFIHSIGMWNEFIKYVTKETEKYKTK